MLSKTILIGLSIFWFGGKKSVHGRPSWEFTKHCDEDFAAWSKLVSKECCFNYRAEKCGVVRFTTKFFMLDKAKALPIRI